MTDCETIYDEQINPLMTKIIEICQANDIPMFASFKYKDDGYCTTYLNDFGEEDEFLKRCRNQVASTSILAVTLTKFGGP